MSFGIMNTGASALRASQRAVETAAHNAANSTVEGYTRQRVSQAAMVPMQGANGVLGSGHIGTGVQVVGIDRLRDVLADLSLRSEASTTGREEVRAEVLDRAQAVLGHYGNGLPDALSKLWGAFDQLSLNPSEPAARQIVVDSAVAVADGLNAAARGLQDIRTDSITRARDEVREVNALAKEVANLNVHIVAARNGGQSPNDLLDRRDVLLDRLATLIGTGSRAQVDGSVTVTVKGNPLVQGSTAFELVGKEVQPPAELAGAEYTLVLNGVRIDDDALGGQLGGRVDALRDDLRDVERDLDRVAASLAEQVNLLHAGGPYRDRNGLHHQFPGGYDLNGDRGVVFFTSTAGTTTTAASIAVNSVLRGADGVNRIAAAATPPTVPVPPASTDVEPLRFDGQNALRLAQLRSRTAPIIMASTTPSIVAGLTVDKVREGGAVTVGQQLNGVASRLGSAASAAMAAAETGRISLSALTDQRSSKNGVNLDEEMVELVKFQHSYDAAARVISIADQMLDTLINRMGA